MSLSTPTRTRDAATTKATILDAAEHHFAESGFAGARVDEIARSAGYNKSLIFQYFTDKDGLYRAVLARCRETGDAAFRQSMDVDAVLAADLTPKLLHETLEASVGWVFDHFVAHPNFVRLFAWEMALGWGVFRQSGEHLEPSFQFGFELLRRARARALLRAGIAPETVITNILNLPLVTLASTRRFGDVQTADAPPVDIATLREQTVRFVLNAVLRD